MKCRTCRTWIATACAFAFLALMAPLAARAQHAGLLPAIALDPASLDGQQVAQTLFTFDMLVGSAQIAAQQDAAESRQLDHNALRVATRPEGFSVRDARALWSGIQRIAPHDARAALALLVQSDVVTTEAHALLLQMLGPPPAFTPHAAPAGLGPRQLAWTELAPQLSVLMQRAWRDGRVASLYARLRPTLAALTPTDAELASYVALLDHTMGRPALPQERVRVLIVPLMAKDTGATLMLGRRGAISLIAPTADKKERATLVIHEMLHPRISALIAEHDDLRQALQRGTCLRGALLARTTDQQVSQVYDGWDDYFAESWVRGLSHQLAHTTEPNDGFLLAHELGALIAHGASGDALADGATGLLQQWTVRLCHAPA